jgi:multidrug efflux pump subunit AcrB
LMFIGVMTLGSMTIKFSLFPDIDIDTVHIKVELPAGSSFEETLTVVKQLEREARDYVDARDLMNVTSQVGHHDSNFYGATEGRNQAWGLIAVQLVPINDRQGDTSTRGVEQTLQNWGESLAGNFKLTVVAQDDMPVTGEAVQMEVISSGDERFEVADEVGSWLRQHPAIKTVWSSYAPGKDVIDLEINHGLLASRGLTMEQLIRAVSVAVDGLLVDELQTLDERVRYRLQLPRDKAGSLNSLRNLPIINSRGEAIYISAVADFTLRPGEANIKHYRGKRTVTVFATIDDAQTSASLINVELREFIDGQDWAERYPELRLVDSGAAKQTAEVGADLNRAALICLLAIFAAMVILFNSLSQPIMVMLCLPFGLIGVVLAYSLQGMDMGSMAITGIIGLMGVLVNDSLVLLHTFNEKRREIGTFLELSEVAALARQRFRPIVITSITTFVGLVPTAYGILGENSYLTPVFMSMAWGVAFGGLVSLILLPMLYMIDQDIRAKFFSTD